MANPSRRSFQSFVCAKCFLRCKTEGGLIRHNQTIHRDFTPVSDDDDDEHRFTVESHPFLNGMKPICFIWHHLTFIFPGIPCNARGEYLPPYTRPPPTAASANAGDGNPWNPFNSRIEFDFAYYHFVDVQSSAEKIDRALDLWAASLMEYGGDAPWKDSAELYAMIDAIQDGDCPWKVYHICYKGPHPPGMPPKWMTEMYELCARDSCQVLHHQLSTTAFKDKFNAAPYCQVNNQGIRTRSNLMSADWAWKQAVRDTDLGYSNN